MSLTEQHLAELERLAASATPPPWVQSTATRVVSAAALERLRDDEEAPLVARIPLGSPDGPFVAAAREAVPQLVAEVRRLREAMEAAARALTPSAYFTRFGEPADEQQVRAAKKLERERALLILREALEEPPRPLG